MSNEARSEGRLDNGIRLGSDMLSALAGGGISLLGPEATVAAGPLAVLLSHTFRYIGMEFKQRHLSRRELFRTNTMLYHFAHKCRDNLNHGQMLRDDEFFEDDVDDRSPMGEIAEGVVLAAQREHEEKKLKYYGNLVANIAFDALIDRNTANTLLKLAEELSYHQVCYLALLARKGAFGLSTTDQTVLDYILPDASRAFTPQAALAKDIHDLFQRGVLLQGGPGDVEHYNLLPFVTTLGHALYNLMDLADVPASDLSDIARVIQTPRELSGVRGRPVNVWRLASDRQVLVGEIIQIFLRNVGDKFTVNGVEVTKRYDASTAIWPFGYAHEGYEIVECVNDQKFVIGTGQFNGLES